MPNYRTNPNYGRNTGYMSQSYSYNNKHEENHPNNQDTLSSLPIAMAYVPIQKWGKTFELGEGLSNGTIFPDLYKPFLGGNCYYDAKNRY